MMRARTVIDARSVFLIALLIGALLVAGCKASGSGIAPGNEPEFPRPKPDYSAPDRAISQALAKGFIQLDIRVRCTPDWGIIGFPMGSIALEILGMQG